MSPPLTFLSVPGRFKIERINLRKCCLSLVVINGWSFIEDIAECHGNVHLEEVGAHFEIA